MAALAPDAAALTAARRLARPGPWSDTGSTDRLVWGKCQGSGAVPYQVSVDLTGPAFRCTCPSRKLPCKHGLALLLLWVDGAGSVADVSEVAAFAQDWAAERRAGAGGPAAGVARRANAKVPDPQARARRLEERLALMSGGMDDFARWLGDLARGGTASARSQPYAWWDSTAARLVDAQLPGLAEQVRAMGSEVHARADWADHLLVTMGRWWTASRAWARRERLEADELGDLRAYVGWSTSTESVREADAVHDRWTVLGAHRSDDGRLQQQRTWLRGSVECGSVGSVEGSVGGGGSGGSGGSGGEIVQVLDFAAGGTVLPVARVVGSVLDATLARYPGRAVRRALFVDEPVAVQQSDPDAALTGGLSLDQAQGVAAKVWARNPWARRVPVLLADVRTTAAVRGIPRSPVTGEYLERVEGPGLVDANNMMQRLTDDAAVWDLLALTGGHPATMFGELEGDRIRPLSVAVDGRLVAL